MKSFGKRNNENLNLINYGSTPDKGLTVIWTTKYYFINLKKKLFIDSNKRHYQGCRPFVCTFKGNMYLTDTIEIALKCCV